MATGETAKIIQNFKEQLSRNEAAMKHDFSAVRTGKASPALVEGVMVEYYGAQTKLRDLASITAPEPRLLMIQPYDATAVAAIEKAIIASNIGIMPNSDGKIIRLPIPELSQERRQTLVKQVKQRSEEAKVSARNHRRDANEVAKKAQKDSLMTEDELRKMLDDIQKETDKAIAEIDKILAAKDKELMSI